MTIIYFAVAIAVIAGGGWLMNKIGGVALVGLNRGVLYRRSYQEGKHLRDGFTILTSASIPALMEELETYVCVVDAPLGLNQVFYESARAKKGVAWTYGHMSETKLEAVLVLSEDGEMTRGMFTVTAWREEDGLLDAQDELKKLRLQVLAAIRASDPEVRISEGAPDQSEVAARYAEVFSTAN